VTTNTDLLIIGAGPFGLSMAAYAAHWRLDHRSVGKPMEFWKSNMPKGMYLRSACDWHLDPAGIDTIESFLKAQNLTAAQVEPLSLEFYLSYASWFQQRKRHRAASLAYPQARLLGASGALSCADRRRQRHHG
jgi:cation diffusion facilitator CzcD-associated flavoprotein CzcO